MRSPDEWAAAVGRGATGAWCHKVPAEVRKVVLASNASVRLLVDWFHEEVAAAYPGHTWPAEASKSRVEKLLEVLRAKP